MSSDWGFFIILIPGCAIGLLLGYISERYYSKCGRCRYYDIVDDCTVNGNFSRQWECKKFRKKQMNPEKKEKIIKFLKVAGLVIAAGIMFYFMVVKRNG